jgi:predicted nucleotidyltransferase
VTSTLTKPTAAQAALYRRTARERWQAQQRARAERFDRAWVVARAAAEMLRDRFGARRVVLFGSLTDRDRFRLTSDIDLAAWGIKSIEFYTAVAAILDFSGEFKIDLVDPESCRATLRQAIEQEGIELWSPPSLRCSVESTTVTQELSAFADQLEGLSGIYEDAP